MDEVQVVVVATRLKLRGWRRLWRFMRLTRAVERQLKEAVGLEGYWLDADFRRLRFHTLSVWSSEQAMGDFMRSGPHRDAMAAFDAIADREASGFIRWKTSDPAMTTWEEADRRLAELDVE